MKKILLLSLFLFNCDEDEKNQESIIQGCIDFDACNYDINATLGLDNEFCEYAEECKDCDGNCLNSDNCTEDCLGECGGSTVCLNIYDVWKQNDPLTRDSNGYYHFGYNPTGMSDSDYGTVKYLTEQPLTRVFWTSPDSFFVYYMDEWFGDPIINYSTYSGDDGYGQQLFYVYAPFVGDTLTIYGYIDSDIIDTVFVIVE